MYSVTLLLLFTVTALECVNEVKLDAFIEHQRRISKFPCGVPQPRTWSAKDLLPSDVYAREIVSYFLRHMLKKIGKYFHC